MRSRLIVFLIGLLFTLAALEAVARVFAYVHVAAVDARQRESFVEKIQRPRRILVLGNSFTLGMGAEEGEDYPSQLQLLFDADRPGAVAVFNESRVSATSGYHLEHLSRYLALYRPQLVVAMIGQPNQWNMRGWDAYLARKEARPRLGTRMWALLQKSALVRMVSVVRWQLGPEGGGASAARTRRPGANDAFEREAFHWLVFHSPYSLMHETFGAAADLGIDALERLYASGKERGPAARHLALLYYFQKSDPEKAVAAATRFLAADPGFDFFVHEVLSRSAGREVAGWAEAMAESRRRAPPEKSRLALADWFLSGRVGGPRSFTFMQGALKAGRGLPNALDEYFKASLREGKFAEGFAELSRVINETGNSGLRRQTAERMVRASRGHPEAAAKVREFLRDAKQRFPGESLFAEVSDIFDPAAIDEWVRADLAELHRRLAEAGVTLVLQTYPPVRGSLASYGVDAQIRSFAASAGVLLSDTYAHLLPDLKQQGERAGYFSPSSFDDPHLSARGYRAIAEGLYGVLRERTAL